MLGDKTSAKKSLATPPQIWPAIINFLTPSQRHHGVVLQQKIAPGTLRGNYTAVMKLYIKFLEKRNLNMVFESEYLYDFIAGLPVETPFAYLKALGGTFNLALVMTDGHTRKWDEKCQTLAAGKLRSAAPWKKPTVKTPELKPEVLYKILMKEIWEKNLEDITPKLFRAIVCILLQYVGVSRFSDLRKLNANDVSLRMDENNQEIIVLHFRSSKTDQLYEGSNTVISQGKKDYNPVEIIKRYFSKFGLRFQGVGALDPRPLFPAFKPGIGKRMSNGVRPTDLEIYPVSRGTILKDQEYIVNKYGHKGRYTHVSNKAGGTTLAHRNGVPDKVIKEQGRWSSNHISERFRRDNTDYKAKYVNGFMPGNDVI